MAAMALSGTRGRGRGHGTPDLQGQAMADRDRHRLLDLIDEATMSPSKHLDVGLLQFIKELVRASDANVRTAFESLYDKLKKNHSQVRNSPFLIPRFPSVCTLRLLSSIRAADHHGQSTPGQREIVTGSSYSRGRNHGVPTFSESSYYTIFSRGYFELLLVIDD